MDKNAIKKFAVWARRELIARVSQKAAQYGIEENSIVDGSADHIGELLLTADQKKQRRALIAQIKEKGYQQVMERVAYVWFNRFVALRYMEVNNYLPTHVRVFTNENNEFKPQILTEAIHLEMDELDMERVYALKEKDANDELYQYLLVTQCKELSKILPKMFTPFFSADFSILLMPDNLLREDSIIHHLITDISEEDWRESTDVIGWLYQYYVSEKHDEIVNIYKGTVAQKDVPAATQLFTTDWVVRYMVDNSLGRYWIERHPESNLAEKLEFLVKPKDGKIQTINESVTPQDLTFFDPCMGSGHILAYAFDVLMEIYREYGYTDREAVSEIIQNNLHGFDIDERCTQLAYFVVMMKARQYDARFFKRKVYPQVYYPKADSDLKAYGSLLQVDTLETKPEEPEEITFFDQNYEILLNDWNCRRLLSQKYAVVCTNPPYLNKYNDKLKKFVTENYKDYSGDLFSVFIYRNFGFCKKDGYSAFMTPFVWMFIKTYEKLREYIINCKAITSLIQMEYSAFEEATVPICSFVLQNCKSENQSLCFRLSDFKGGMEVQKEKVIEAIQNPDCGYFYEAQQSNFSKIPGLPICYHANERLIEIIETSHSIKEIVIPRVGLQTNDTDRFTKLWFEVEINKIGFNYKSREEAQQSNRKWFPFNKGGKKRKWYGNNDYLVNWENDGDEIRKYNLFLNSSRESNIGIGNTEFYFKENGTWTAITSGELSVRFSPFGYINSNAGMAIYGKKIRFIIGLLNSKCAVHKLIKIYNESLNFNVGDISRIPVKFNQEESVNRFVEENINLSKTDWNSFEISWDFTKHPLIRSVSTVADAFAQWENECNDRFNQLKANEEELNRVFIDIYGLQEELTPEVEDKDVTVRKADLQRDIKSLISYAVGCMFGRYSPLKDGLLYAGGDWDYAAIQQELMDAIGKNGFSSGDMVWDANFIDKDNIIPICDDEYFEDDIVGRFINFISAVYGKDTLEENLKFIADALGGKGQPKEVIRNYFLNDFFADHCKIYQKRPIYWLFDSGKKNGFKALIYMHRYQPDTIARIRTDYVHEQQARYRTAIQEVQRQLTGATTADKVRLNKKLNKLTEQDAELRTYEEKIHHLADQMIPIDLDDGVKINHAKFQDVLARIK